MKDIANINIETKRLTLRNLKFYDITSDYIDWLNIILTLSVSLCLFWLVRML